MPQSEVMRDIQVVRSTCAIARECRSIENCGGDQTLTDEDPG
jgi:hypothetical protein